MGRWLPLIPLHSTRKQHFYSLYVVLFKKYCSFACWFASHPPDDQRMNNDYVYIIGVVACGWGCRKTLTCFILWLGGRLVPSVIGNTGSATISFKTACCHRTVAAWSSSVVSLASRSLSFQTGFGYSHSKSQRALELWFVRAKLTKWHCK